MANRNYTSSRLYSMHQMVVSLDMRIAIGASGAPTLTSNSQVASVTRLAAGQYRIQLADNFNKIICMNSLMESPAAGSSVPGGSFVTGTVYQIQTLGSTTQAQWVTAGLPSNLTAAVGQVFKAAGAGAGTGTVKILGNSGISSIEITASSQTMLAPAPAPNLGGYIVFQTLAPTSSSVTTMIPADPANGSVIKLDIKLLNSSN